MQQPLQHKLSEEQLDHLVDQLVEQGFGIVDQFISDEETRQFIRRFHDLSEEGELRKAGIGKMQHFAVDKKIRGDYIRWIDPQDMAAVTAGYVGRVQQIMEYLNRSCYLGLKDFEAHFAMYPEGTFYKRHADRFHQNPHRVISMVCYMNQGWTEADGGQLRMFLPDQEIDIEPLSGRLVCFKSELEHEVLLTHRTRYSVTGWMLDQLSGLTFL